MGAARMRHPVTGAMYTGEADLVRVEDGGRVGHFRENGAWVRGDLRQADPLMCKWIAGHAFGDTVPFRNQRLQADTGTGWKPSSDSTGQS
ncbi:MAG: hypothetical protein RJA99_124 [Pseudomonadota bacterium]|jgi:hypothetical protein